MPVRLNSVYNVSDTGEYSGGYYMQTAIAHANCRNLLNKTNYKHFIAFTNILAGACPACTGKFLLAEASWLPQAISLVPDCPYTIRKMVLRSIWLLLAVSPLFLPQMEEEDDSLSMLQVFS